MTTAKADRVRLIDDDHEDGESPTFLSSKMPAGGIVRFGSARDGGTPFNKGDHLLWKESDGEGFVTSGGERRWFRVLPGRVFRKLYEKAPARKAKKTSAKPSKDADDANPPDES